MKDRQVFVSERLSKYLNMTNLYVFSKIVAAKKTTERYKQDCEKFNFDQVYLSLGGALLLNIRGNGGILDIPVKLPRQAADKSIYCA